MVMAQLELLDYGKNNHRHYFGRHRALDYLTDYRRRLLLKKKTQT